VRVKFAEFGGVRTRYLHAGEGAPLLLLHGVGMSADCFMRNIDALAENQAVYAIDLIGHGFTDAADFGGVAPQVAMARHVVAMADGLGLKSYSIGGFSFGALVAGLMYFQQPQRVEKLILIGSGSAFHPSDEQRKTLTAAAENGVKAMRDPTLESCRVRARNIVHDPASIPEELLWLQLTSYALPDRLSAYAATIEGAIAHMDDPAARIFAQLEQIACPADVIVGRNDIRADWRWHEKGIARMPDARLTIYEQCGHMPFLEYADRFNAQAAEFLQSKFTGDARRANNAAGR
jgi:2-hydroxy-6-oxonona-2,4-dienedioate hydrolase